MSNSSRSKYILRRNTPASNASEKNVSQHLVPHKISSDEIKNMIVPSCVKSQSEDCISFFFFSYIDIFSTGVRIHL